MVSSGRLRRLLGPLGVALWMLTVSAGAVLADEVPPTCSVEVAPAAAPAGSVFVFSGTGFQPNELTLLKTGGDPVVHQLSVGDTDPWEVTVRSRTGDEGSWTATFSDPETECTAITRFRVTLTPTDVVDDIVAATQAQSAPLLLYSVVIVLGFGGGVAIGRRMNARALA
jgi:hypothetical protein